MATEKQFTPDEYSTYLKVSKALGRPVIENISDDELMKKTREMYPPTEAGDGSDVKSLYDSTFGRRNR